MTEETTTGWRMDLPEGWFVWQPGAPDVAALCAAATSGRRAELSLARRIRIAEKEAAVLPGDVGQVGVRVTEPRTGAVSASMYLTLWARPTEQDGKLLNARRHLPALEATPPDPGRVYRHREASIEQVPAGQLVLSNEVSRAKLRPGWSAELVTTIFPHRTEMMFELTMSSRFGDLQPQLMAELSLMAHSFRLEQGH